MDRDNVGGQSYLCYLYDINPSTLKLPTLSVYVRNCFPFGFHSTSSPAPSIHSEAPTGSDFWARMLVWIVGVCVNVCIWVVFIDIIGIFGKKWRHSWVWSEGFGSEFSIRISDLHEQFQNKSFLFPTESDLPLTSLLATNLSFFVFFFFFYVHFWLYFMSGKNILFLFVSLVSLICQFGCVFHALRPKAGSLYGQ